MRWLALGFMLLGGSALAQPNSGGQITAEELIEALQQIESSLLTRPAPPVGSFAVAPGFALSGGQVMVALAASDSRGGSSDSWDGSGGIGFGLGDPVNGVGFQAIASINSVDPSDFGDSGSLGLTLHKQLPVSTGAASVAVGVRSLAGWGDSDGVDEQFYTSGSWAFPLGDSGLPLMLTLGYGSGADSTDSVFNPDGAVYGSVGLGLTQHFAVSAGWDGDEAVAGVDIRPVTGAPIQFSVGAIDLTEELGDTRFVITASWLASF